MIDDMYTHFHSICLMPHAAASVLLRCLVAALVWVCCMYAGELIATDANSASL
jgi:hypothetical protein